MADGAPRALPWAVCVTEPASGEPLCWEAEGYLVTRYRVLDRLRVSAFAPGPALLAVCDTTRQAMVVCEEHWAEQGTTSGGNCMISERNARSGRRNGLR